MVNLQAESLVLGPVTLHKPVFAMKLSSKEVTLQSWQADLLGGTAKGDGSVAWNGNQSGSQPGNQLTYKLAGEFKGVSGAQLGALLGHPAPAAKPESDDAADVDGKTASVVTAGSGMWIGGPVDGSGKVELSGLTEKELAASAAGTVHFHWVKGAAPISVLSGPEGTEPAKGVTPVTAMRFDAWSGDATIDGGKIALGSNTLSSNAKNQGQHASAVAGEVPFGGPARLTLSIAKPQETQASPEAAKK